MRAFILVLALALGATACTSAAREAPAFANEPAEPRPESTDDGSDEEDPLGGLPAEVPAAEAAAPPIAPCPAPATLRGLVLALSADRRAALVLDAEARATLVVREDGARHARIPVGATVTAVGDPRPRGVIAARTLAIEEAPLWQDLPSAHELDDDELADPLLRPSDWVIVPDVLALDPRTVVSRRQPDARLRVRAPRGAIAPRAGYRALRGVIVDVTAIEPHGGEVLWIVRAEDVIRI